MVHGVHLTWGYLGETVKKREKSKAVLAIVASAKSEKPAQGLAMPEGPAQDPDQPVVIETSAAAEDAAPAAFEGALPEEGAAPVGAAPGTTGNIG